MIECLLLILLKTRSNSPGAKTLNDVVSSYAVRTKFRVVAFNEESRVIALDCMPS